MGRRLVGEHRRRGPLVAQAHGAASLSVRICGLPLALAVQSRCRRFWGASPRATPGPPARRASYAGTSLFCGHTIRTTGALPTSIEWVPCQSPRAHTHTHTHAAPGCPPALAPGLQACVPSRVLRKSLLTPGAARSVQRSLLPPGRIRPRRWSHGARTHPESRDPSPQRRA